MFSCKTTDKPMTKKLKIKSKLSRIRVRRKECKRMGRNSADLKFKK